MIYYYLYCFILFSTVSKFCLYAIKPNPKSPQHPIPRGYKLLFFMLLEPIFVGDSMVSPLSACLPVCCLFVSLSVWPLVCLFVYLSVFLCRNDGIKFYQENLFHQFREKEKHKIDHSLRFSCLC